MMSNKKKDFFEKYTLHYVRGPTNICWKANNTHSTAYATDIHYHLYSTQKMVVRMWRTCT